MIELIIAMHLELLLVMGVITGVRLLLGDTVDLRSYEWVCVPGFIEWLGWCFFFDLIHWD